MSKSQPSDFSTLLVRELENIEWNVFKILLKYIYCRGVNASTVYISLFHKWETHALVFLKVSESFKFFYRNHYVAYIHMHTYIRYKHTLHIHVPTYTMHKHVYAHVGLSLCDSWLFNILHCESKLPSVWKPMTKM